MTDQPSDRICVMHHRRDPERKRPAAHGHLCVGCYRDLCRAFAQLGALYVDLEAVLALGGGNGLAPRTSGSGEWDPLPIRGKVADHRDDIVRVLVSWVMLVAEERDLADLPVSRSPHVTATWLQTHVDWMTEQPWCDDMAGEILGLYRRAQSLIDQNRTRVIDQGPCSRQGCEGTVRIRARDRDDYLPATVECDGPERHEYQPSEYVALAAGWAKMRATEAMRESA